MPRASVPLVPKDPGGPLRVLVIGRISTAHQDKENIKASYRYVQQYLEQIYQGPLSLKQLGEQASGMRTDRATIREAEEEIATGTWDLVITEDLARFYRNPRFQYTFVQDAVDNGTRVICIGDSLDTADENWEVALGAAALRHGLYIPDTRRRVRRTATHAFHNGGMVLKVRYGYRKLTKEEAASGQFGPKGLRLAKLSECTKVIRAIRERILRGDHYVAVAEWLNETRVPLSPYTKKGRWTAKLVQNLLRAPILSGTRTFRVMVHEPVFKTGRHRRRRNEAGPETEHYPELAHLSVEEHRELLQVMAERAALHPRRSGPAHPRYGIPRSRAIWPQQHARCGICGGMMYRFAADQLKCQNSNGRGDRNCWNHVQVPCRLLRERVLNWVLSVCGQTPQFHQFLVDAAVAELAVQRRRAEQKSGTLEQEIAELENQAANLARAIALGGEMEALVRQLGEVNHALHMAQEKRVNLDRQVGRELTTLTRAEVEARLEGALAEVAGTSYEFAQLMRRVLAELLIVPVQALDSGQVRPRARVTLRFEALTEGGSGEPEHGDGAVRGEIDLFDAPVHIGFASQCRAAKAENPQMSRKEIAGRLGIHYMTVKRALDYARRMEAAGLTVPYRELEACPASASRWRPRKPRPMSQGGNG